MDEWLMAWRLLGAFLRFALEVEVSKLIWKMAATKVSLDSIA